MKFLHLTHTDILRDSRILKEIASLNTAYAGRAAIHGLGLETGEGPDHDLGEIASKVANIRVPFLSFWRGTARHVLTFIGLFFPMLIRALVMRPQLVHCHDAMVLPIGLVIKWITGCKLVYDAHELETQRNAIGRVQQIVTTWIERLAWRSVDLFITVSPSIIDWYENTYGSKFNRLVLNAPVPPVKNLPDKADAAVGGLRDKLGVPTAAKLFVYVGMFSLGRGIERLLEAFEAPDLTAHLVCIGWGRLEGLVSEAAAKNDRIHLHPVVSHDKLVSLIADADIGVCLIENVSLSDYYALPNKLFEYSFAGLSVLASNFPEIIKVVDDYQLGVCVAPEPAAIAQGVRHMQDTSYKPDISAMAPIGWQAQAAALADGYLQILGR